MNFKKYIKVCILEYIRTKSHYSFNMNLISYTYISICFNVVHPCFIMLLTQCNSIGVRLPNAFEVDFAEWSQFSREMREELCTALTLDVKSFVSPFDLTDFFESYSLQKRLA